MPRALPEPFFLLRAGLLRPHLFAPDLDGRRGSRKQLSHHAGCVTCHRWSTRDDEVSTIGQVRHRYGALLAHHGVTEDAPTLPFVARYTSRYICEGALGGDDGRP